MLWAAVLSGCATLYASASDGYRVIRAYPHDRQAFTQGLVYADGHLYESTGLEGHSSLRMTNLVTGRILQFHEVPGKYFAEGLTEWRGKLIQLTWQSHLAFVYDRFTFRQLQSFPIPCDGWGLTHDGKSLILSDGTAKLRFLDPVGFRVTKTITVKDRGVPVTQLNELEFIHGQIFANVWHSNRIARIAPATGNVLGWIDLSGLMPELVRSNPEAVLNGIAYDPDGDRIFVTGKYWPEVFEIRIVPEETGVAPLRRKHGAAYR